MVLCEQHHRQVTNGAIDQPMQRSWKARPFNVQRGSVNGQLVHSSKIIAVEIGSNYLVGAGFKLFVDDVSLLRMRCEDGRLLLSLDVRDDLGQDQLVIVDNEWVTGPKLPWDLEYHYNYIKVRSGRGNVTLEVDARTEPICIYGKLKLQGSEFVMRPDSLQVGLKKGCAGLENLGLVLLQLVIDTNNDVVHVEPAPGFGQGVIVSWPEPKERLQRSYDALRRSLKNMKVGRNDACPCRSGKKWKNCCWTVVAP